MFRKGLKFDKFGFLSNRDHASKYWGVSYRDALPWVCINYRDQYGFACKVDVSLKHLGLATSTMEKVCAEIAAHIYNRPTLITNKRCDFVVKSKAFKKDRFFRIRRKPDGFYECSEITEGEITGRQRVLSGQELEAA